MKSRFSSIALSGAVALLAFAAPASAFSPCPASAPDCTEYTGAGKSGGFFRILVPADWDGDLVIYNHGFALEREGIRGHETCSNSGATHCEADADCGVGDFCNNISLGVDSILLPLHKAVAASTYSKTGWAVFGSSKDIKDILKFVKKEIGAPTRVIVTGHSLGGAVTADATLKLKLDGAVPMCGAVAGGLPTWDVAGDVRLVYDFLCDGVAGAKFGSAPDSGEATTANSGNDAITMAGKVNTCFGVISPSSDPPTAAAQASRLADFYSLTSFTGTHGQVATAMGFATLGMGDFVHDPNRLKDAHIGWNSDPDLDYSTMGSDTPLATSFDAGVKPLTKGKGRAKLTKASYPDFTKGKGKGVDYPILSMAGTGDWLVIPSFEVPYDTAATLGGKHLVQTWVDIDDHCTFSSQETTALFNVYFDWLDSPDYTAPANIPAPAALQTECLTLAGGVAGSTCRFNASYTPEPLYDRVPERSDWAPGAKHP